MSLLAPISAGVQKLVSRVTSSRASNLDAIVESRMAKLDALNARITDTRAAYLDMVNLLNNRLTDARGNKLDNLDASVDSRLSLGAFNTANSTNAGVLAAIYADSDALDSRISEARLHRLDAAFSSEITRFQSAGSYSFVVPANVRLVCATLVGGGGGGSSRGNNVSSLGLCGGGAAVIYRMPVIVEPGETLSLVVGAGGVGASDTGFGGDGGASTMLVPSLENSVFSAGGGKGGEDDGDGGVVTVNGVSAAGFAPVGGGCFHSGVGQYGSTGDIAYAGYSFLFTERLQRPLTSGALGSTPTRPGNGGTASFRYVANDQAGSGSVGLIIIEW